MKLGCYAREALHRMQGAGERSKPAQFLSDHACSLQTLQSNVATEYLRDCVVWYLYFTVYLSACACALCKITTGWSKREWNGLNNGKSSAFKETRAASNTTNWNLKSNGYSRKKRVCQMQLWPTPFDMDSIQGEISCNNHQTVKGQDWKAVREGRTDSLSRLDKKCTWEEEMVMEKKAITLQKDNVHYV